jgi:hypothetical protein
LEGEGLEEIFRVVPELSDNMPDKAALLDNCGDGFLRNFLSNKNRKEDIDNCILAYESSVRLTPQGSPDMSGRINMLALSYYRRFNLAGDLGDISKVILYQQKAIHLIPVE